MMNETLENMMNEIFEMRLELQFRKLDSALHDILGRLLSVDFTLQEMEDRLDELSRTRRSRKEPALHQLEHNKPRKG